MRLALEVRVAALRADAVAALRADDVRLALEARVAALRVEAVAAPRANNVRRKLLVTLLAPVLVFRATFFLVLRESGLSDPSDPVNLFILLL